MKEVWRRAMAFCTRARVRKAVKILGKAGMAALLVTAAALALFVVKSRLEGRPPGIAGLQVLAVNSGSMVPAFGAGSAVLVKPVDPAEINPGDIITYALGDSLITHRVVAREGEGFVTRGDANDSPDPGVVDPGDVVGKVVGAIPLLGHVLNFVWTPLGLVVTVLGPGIMLIVIEVRRLWLLGQEWLAKSRERGGEGANGEMSG